MYSPTDIDFCYKQGHTVIQMPLLQVTYSTHEAVPLELDADEEGRSVEEEHVPLPVSWIVVRLCVDCSWHGPNSSSTHFLFF